MNDFIQLLSNVDWLSVAKVEAPIIVGLLAVAFAKKLWRGFWTCFGAGLRLCDKACQATWDCIASGFDFSDRELTKHESRREVRRQKKWFAENRPVGATIEEATKAMQAFAQAGYRISAEPEPVPFETVARELERIGLKVFEVEHGKRIGDFQCITIKATRNVSEKGASGVPTVPNCPPPPPPQPPPPPPTQWGYR